MEEWLVDIYEDIFMFHGNYRFQSRLEFEAHLPECMASAVKGIFGRPFKEVGCTLERPNCPACLLKQECLCTRAFESESALAAAGTGHRSPQSFLHSIQPLFNGKTFYPQGTPFKFKPPLFTDLSRRAWPFKWTRTPLPGKDGGR
jgi:hypothetical protein